MQNEHENTGLASSLTDLMTSLAVIFILLLVAMLNNALQQTKGTKSQVLARFEETLKDFQKQGVEVQTDPKDPLGLLVVVPEGLLKFEQGRAEIPAGGKDFVREFIPKLVSTACSSELKAGINSIVVEGHASSEGDEARNLRLSQARSIAVVQDSLDVLDNAGNDNASAYHKCFVDLVSATGRGSAEPIKVVGVEDRSLSRRVVFKIRVKSLEQRGLESKPGIADLKPVESGDIVR
jgi:outer membrane protein OmpA-like peptidoglycan-associated protein